MAGMALRNASPITLQMSGVNVSYVFMRKNDFLSTVFNLTADSTFCTF